MVVSCFHLGSKMEEFVMDEENRSRLSEKILGSHVIWELWGTKNRTFAPSLFYVVEEKTGEYLIVYHLLHGTQQKSQSLKLTSDLDPAKSPQEDDGDEGWEFVIIWGCPIAKWDQEAQHFQWIENSVVIDQKGMDLLDNFSCDGCGVTPLPVGSHHSTRSNSDLCPTCWATLPSSLPLEWFVATSYWGKNTYDFGQMRFMCWVPELPCVKTWVFGSGEKKEKESPS